MPGEITLTYPAAKNRLKDIAEELERLDGKADAAETRSLDTADKTYFDELVAEADALDRHCGKLEREAARIRVGRTLTARGAAGPSRDSERAVQDLDADPLGEPDSIEERRFRNPWDLSEIRTFNRTTEDVGAELRARALSAVEKMQGMNDRRRSAATDIIERFDNDRGDISRMALATSSPHYLRAFAKAARGQMATFTPEEAAAVQRAMSLTDNAGGYLVPFQLDPTVIITSDGSFNEIRKVARQVVATGDVWNGVSSGAVTWRFRSEATEATDNSTTFAQPSINVRTADGFVPISIEALQDESNVAQEVGRLLAFGRDTLEATKFILGSSGSGEPIGIVTALTGTSSIVTSTTTDTFALGDIYKTQGSLPARYRMRASWLGNNLTYNLTRQFTVAGGADVWAPMTADRPATLLGKNAYEAEAMDGVVTALAENYMLVFGDWNEYVIADRIGMTVEFIPHLFGTTANYPSGQRGWYAYYRVGADSVNDGAFRMLNVT